MFFEAVVAFGEVIRLIVIVAGFVAMWSLWVARDRRGRDWTGKMKDIWLCHMLFVASAVESNIEYLYRHTAPTAATMFLGFVMMWTVKGTFNGDMYTKDDDRNK